jgi:class 3 adenylate cyclase
MEHRNAVVLAADAAGFSRMISIDDERTLTVLLRCRQIFLRHVRNHSGRVFGMSGDSVMVVFSEPTNAVLAAIAIQRAIHDENAVLAEEARLEFRIGIDSGNVIIAGDDLFGDCVNIASCLQRIVPPSGICITRAIQEHPAIRALALEFAHRGSCSLKYSSPRVQFFQLLNYKHDANLEQNLAQPSRNSHWVRLCDSSWSAQVISF